MTEPTTAEILAALDRNTTATEALVKEMHLANALKVMDQGGHTYVDEGLEGRPEASAVYIIGRNIVRRTIRAGFGIPENQS